MSGQFHLPSTHLLKKVQGKLSMGTILNLKIFDSKLLYHHQDVQHNNKKKERRIRLIIRSILNLPGVASLHCTLARLIISAIQSAGAFRFIYAGVIILDQARRAVTALDASAGARVSRHVGRALRVHLRAAFVVHVSVRALERCKCI
jgi:hypothetical protein